MVWSLFSNTPFQSNEQFQSQHLFKKIPPPFGVEDFSNQLNTKEEQPKTLCKVRRPKRAATGKRMGKRVEGGGAGVPPATIPESENPPKTTCFP